MTEEQNNTPNIWNDFAARALRTGAPIPSVQIEFDAEMARLGLAWNFTNNRKKKPAVVDMMTKAISDGSFTSGTTLRIAYDNLLNCWVLVDGQHRLAAVEASSIKQWFVVIVDSRPAHITYASLDRLGSMRTEGDAINGLLKWQSKHWTKVIAALKLMRHGHSVTEARKLRMTPAEAESFSKFTDEYKETIIRIQDIVTIGDFWRSGILSVMLPAARYQPDVFFPWVTKAFTDNGISKGSIEMRLLDLCQMPSSNDFETGRLIVMSAYVWNAKYKGQSMEKLPNVKWTADIKTPFPGIAGTPYAK